MPEQIDEIPVVWLHDPDDATHYWERDWLRFLLSGLPVRHCPAMETSSMPLDRALVIVGNDVVQPEVRAYLGAYRQTRRRYGIMHLSDEYLSHDLAIYAGAAVVFRNYYRPSASAHTFGLGYKQGFWDGYHGTPNRLCLSGEIDPMPDDDIPARQHSQKTQPYERVTD